MPQWNKQWKTWIVAIWGWLETIMKNTRITFGLVVHRTIFICQVRKNTVGSTRLLVEWPQVFYDVLRRWPLSLWQKFYVFLSCLQTFKLTPTQTKVPHLNYTGISIELKVRRIHSEILQSCNMWQQFTNKSELLHVDKYIDRWDR